MGRKRHTHFLRDMLPFPIHSWWVCCYQSPNLCRTVHSNSPVWTAKRFSSHLPSPCLTSFSQVEVQGICFTWGLGGWACCTRGNWLLNAEAVGYLRGDPGITRHHPWNDAGTCLEELQEDRWESLYTAGSLLAWTFSWGGGCCSRWGLPYTEVLPG